MTSTYTTAALIEAEIRATTSFSGSTLPSLSQVTSWITEESDNVDGLSGDVFSATTYIEYVDYDGDTDRIQTRHSPIVSVTSVEYNSVALGQTASWATKVSGTDYTTYNHRGEIFIIKTNWQPSEGEKRIRITYVGGYSTTPPKIQKLATKMVAQRVIDSLLHSDVQNGNDGGEIQVGSIRIVDPASYGVNTYKQLVQDIKDLKGELVNNFGVYRYGT